MTITICDRCKGEVRGKPYTITVRLDDCPLSSAELCEHCIRRSKWTGTDQALAAMIGMIPLGKKGGEK